MSKFLELAYQSLLESQKPAKQKKPRRPSYVKRQINKAADKVYEATGSLGFLACQDKDCRGLMTSVGRARETRAAIWGCDECGKHWVAVKGNHHIRVEEYGAWLQTLGRGPCRARTKKGKACSSRARFPENTPLFCGSHKTNKAENLLCLGKTRTGKPCKNKAKYPADSLKFCCQHREPARVV